MANPTFGIDITANDKTAKGAKSAENRVGGIIKNAARAGDKASDSVQKSTASMSRGIIKSASGIDKALTKTFSSSGGVLSRFTSLGEAGAALGEGLGVASVQGGVLASTLGVLGVGAGAAVVTIGAVAYATDKMVGSWAKGVAGAAQLADTIGVTTKALMDFRAAGERVGVDQAASGGALAGLSSSLYNARWGRNTEALNVLNAMGVKMKMDANGNPDTTAMLPAIADALKKQTPQGALQAGAALGIAPDALAMFRQGGAALSADMNDPHIGTPTAGQIALARDWRRKRAMAGQMVQAGMLNAGAGAAGMALPALNGLVGAGGSVMDKGVLGATKEAVQRTLPGAANLMHEGAVMFRNTVAGMTGGGSSFADAIRDRGERSAANAVSPKGARSRMQVMPETAHHPGFGIRPAANESVSEYDRVGKQYADALLAHYGGDWALASAAFNAGPAAADRWIKRNGDPRRGQISDADWIARIPGHARGTYEETRNYAARVALPQPPQVHRHEIHIHRDSVMVKTKTDGSNAETISRTPTGTGF